MSLQSGTSSIQSAFSDNRFRGKVIVITGAGGNFGRAGSGYFALRGAKVAAIDMNPDYLNETIAYVTKEISKSGKNIDIKDVIRSFECDVTKQSSVERAMDSVIRAFGRIDLLWNNAGYQGEIRTTLEYNVEDFSRVVNVNVTGMFIILQAVAKRMVAASAGKKDTGDKKGSWENIQYPYSIVNTSSVAGMRGTPGMIAYASSKAAVLAMTVTSAKDLAPYGIRVNAISPALIGPGTMWERQNMLHAKSGSPYFPNAPDDVAKGKINAVPMRRLGAVEEVVKSVAFLLSDDSSYTTAFNLVVDGGLSGGVR